jgi:hypothetical protein
MNKKVNIEARYPSYKERLLASLTEKKCNDILMETNMLLKWIKKML